MHVASRLIACLIPAMLLATLVQSGCSSCDKEGAPTEEAAAATEGAEEADGTAGKGAADSEAAKAATGEDKAEDPGERAEGALAARAKAAAERAKAAEGASEASVDSLDPEEQRRIDRERRIAELKRRNEERRKELVARAAGGEEAVGGEEAAAQPVPGEGEAAAGEGEAAEAGSPAEAAPDDEAAAAAAVRAAATAEEAVPIAEAAAPAQPTAGPPGLDISRYLNINDVRRITGDRTLTPNGTLSGIPASETYNSVYFAPPVRANFGVSLQIWVERTRRDANDRFRRMRRDFSNAEDTSAAGPKAFFSYWNDILTVSFSDLTKRIVVSVSCNSSICKPDQLLALANAVRERL
jgi:hypothetical protein